ncbi:MAG: FAD-dependent oxidoreductase, partial [Patescibacteria group bacterium]|nr:FAD-dependent oxidoreductase [Patescibacteria group bacterium]
MNSNSTASKSKYDLAIIGTGPAGYTASIYASRYKLSNILIGSILGGQAGEAHKICNFPSHQDISGMDLMTKFQTQAKTLGADEIFSTVVKIDGS